MVLLGIVVGFIVGALIEGVAGGMAGAFTGLILALAWRSHRARQRPAPSAPTASTATNSVPRSVPEPGGADVVTTILARLAAIERRLDRLEQAQPNAARDVAPPPTEPQTPVVPATATAAGDAPLFAASDAAVPGTPGFGADAPAARLHVPRSGTIPLWVWFTTGNVLTRIGVVALFFGVAFLLRYFAEIVTIPIAWKLAGVALVGAALIGLGARLLRTRPGYGLSLQGAGAGVLYLTTFAALRLYDVLPAAPAFVLLVAISAFTIWLALRADAQPLAALAIAGGFLAPFLVARDAGSPALLFGYFAVLNAAIFALAWVRAWRALNGLGFAFTFALGAYWGHRFYQPEHFAIVEPFLALFFVFYVAIAILYARRGPLQAKAPVDALLVFGVPLVGFGLQAALVQDREHGVAVSALALGGVYGALSLALFRRAEPGLALLARAFFVLAIGFATVAIPFLADARWTAAWWALEAAGVYWIGCRQRQPLARWLALLLQVGAALAFVAGGLDGAGPLFLNAAFFGTSALALAGLATAFVGDRERSALSAREQAVIPVLVLWGLAWWYGGGAHEVWRALPSSAAGNALLAYVLVTVAMALVVRRWLHWRYLPAFGAALLPVMVLVAVTDWQRVHTTQQHYGWLAWPLAWVAQWTWLRSLDGSPVDRAQEREPGPRFGRLLHNGHAASAIALVAWLGWEGSEWVGRQFAEGTVWMPCAAAWPAIVYLCAVTFARDRTTWPWGRHRDAYVVSAATAIAALLAVWFAIVNVISRGDAAPLPYAPIVNPLDLTLIAALAALFAWARQARHASETSLYAWWGAAVFVLVNAIVLRTVHQWLDVPWRMSSLLASKPLQAALTLTWTATALPLMVLAHRNAIRPLWMVGAALLAVVVVKLFLIDLASLSGLPRVVAFLGVGGLLLMIGYLAPLPPVAASRTANGAYAGSDERS